MISIAIVLIVCMTVMVVVESILERRPLRRNVYLEKRRVLERDRAEWMRSKTSSPAITQEVQKIDKKLFELAERMPDDLGGGGDDADDET